MSTQTLTNSFLGPQYTLHPHPPSKKVHPNALRLASKKSEALVWTITPSPKDAAKCHISTTLSNGQPKRLDLYNDNSGDKTRVCLADPGDYSGQYWRFVPCEQQSSAAGRWFKLSNDWTGKGWFLDTYSDSYVAHMSQGDLSGQRWWVTVPEVVNAVHAKPSKGGKGDESDSSSSSSDSDGSKKKRKETKKEKKAAGSTMGKLFEKLG